MYMFIVFAVSIYATLCFIAVCSLYRVIALCASCFLAYVAFAPPGSGTASAPWPATARRGSPRPGGPGRGPAAIVVLRIRAKILHADGFASVRI